LTGKLRTRPYTVVLLDEVEKAHPEVLDIFLQVFDEGRLTDAKGKTVDAKNAIFIMTSNIGVEDIRKSPIGFNLGTNNEEPPEPRSLLQGKFRSEFLNRIDEIVFLKNLEPEAVKKITALMFDKLKERLTSQNITLDITEETIKHIAMEGYKPEFGARPLAREIEQLITIPLTEKLLKGDIKPGSIVIIDMESGKIVMNVS
jgi:ATP-dependent Clp protease ATP-binding subunit ClpC